MTSIEIRNTLKMFSIYDVYPRYAFAAKECNSDNHVILAEIKRDKLNLYFAIKLTEEKLTIVQLNTLIDVIQKKTGNDIPVIFKKYRGHLACLVFFSISKENKTETYKAKIKDTLECGIKILNSTSEISQKELGREGN